jgi:hypothetical protein
MQTLRHLCEDMQYLPPYGRSHRSLQRANPLGAAGRPISSAISIASRIGDGRDATSRPNGGVDGDASDGEVATATWADVQAVVPMAVQAAVQPVIQAAACQELEPPA